MLNKCKRISYVITDKATTVGLHMTKEVSECHQQCAAGILPLRH
jgi:hypothetical protein